MDASTRPSASRRRGRSATRKALTIGAVAKILGREFDDISISKIRYLEDQKLLSPRRTPGRLPPLQPGRRRAPARDPAHAARRVPAAAGDPPGAGHGRRAQGLARRRPASLRRAASVDGAGGSRLDLESWSTRRGSAPTLIRELEEWRIVQPETGGGPAALRRDRPRDRQGLRRAGPLRRRRPQPAGAAHLGRPRGGAAGGGRRARAALEQPDAPQARRSRTSRRWPPPAATSPTCCWCATCAS